MSHDESTSMHDYGNITFADEVVAIIAGLAASEIEGVAAMSGGIAGDIVEKLGKKNLSKGVKVQLGEKEVAIDLYIIVEYGARIPEIAWNIQENTKKAVETMTGLNVVEVNIHVQGVNIEKKSKDDEPQAKNK
ncbi:MAG: Asp23/Gls24 family envelope stress response protein [Clostridiales bacterium]|nr:Asp23/Gls24 family envelope stress response protein [Clostridiales bacterium]